VPRGILCTFILASIPTLGLPVAAQTPPPRSIVLIDAARNPGKVAELQALLDRVRKAGRSR
jgi:hypothetical protein